MLTKRLLQQLNKVDWTIILVQIRHLGIFIYLLFFIFTVGLVGPFGRDISVTREAEQQVKEAELDKQKERNEKVQKLQVFFNSLNSPLVEEAEYFVDVADKYNIDWKLLPSIAGVESTGGKFLPYNSYNAWGWGITGDGSAIFFTSWKDAIDSVGKGISENYYSKGYDTVEEIEPIYAPPSLLTGNSWSRGVNYFMNQIENS